MNNLTTKSYLLGFVISVILTLSAYFLVVSHLLGGQILIATIVGLALVQLVVQAIFFLHLREESSPRWKLASFLFFFSAILVIIVGSIWIMNHLNYNHMSPDQVNHYIQNNEAIQK